MKIELEDCTNVIIREIADRKFKRKSIAQTYALALRSSYPTDWGKINSAIINRWSFNALVYIKELAWSGKCFSKELKQ